MGSLLTRFLIVVVLLAGFLSIPARGSHTAGITKVIGAKIGANFNSTADQLIPVDAPKYIIRYIVVTNASTSLTTAAGGFYPTTSKGGTAIVASSQVYTALTGSGKYLNTTLASIAGTDVYTISGIYLSLTTAQGSTATADVYIIGDVLP